MKHFLYCTALLFIAMGCRTHEIQQKEEFQAKEDTVQVVETPTKLVYGLDPTVFEITEGRVKYSETLAKLLYNTGISSDKVNQLIQQSEKVFDSRKIKFGNAYSCYLSGEENKLPQYFIYEIDKREYLRFSLHDSMYVERVQKDADTLRQLSAFSIDQSLWMSMKDQGLDPMLAIELSEIYAWTIDFFGLQRGDSIRVVYDEVYIDGERAGISTIHAAYFKHQGQDMYAIRYEQDGEYSYFDLEGNSLRKAFLKAPLRFSRISSKFSNSRLHPILKIRRPHHGVDYAAPIGTPVQAIGDGTVTSVTYTKGAGRMVKINHNSVYRSAYLHLHSYGKGIKPGVRVTQGQIIGYVGSSGLSTGPHLDFRMYKNNHPVDPLKIESPPVEPVASESMPLYREAVYMALKQLGVEQIYLAVNILN
jgi:murein DD-endopeptidase MepM/ murein hydrolase activator NlpD